jgi:hypothetical protein
LILIAEVFRIEFGHEAEATLLFGIQRESGRILGGDHLFCCFVQVDFDYYPLLFREVCQTKIRSFHLPNYFLIQLLLLLELEGGWIFWLNDLSDLLIPLVD